MANPEIQRSIAGESSVKARKARRVLAAVILATLFVNVWVCWVFVFPGQDLPDVSVNGLDPAVAKLVSSSLDEVRGAPRSGAAWGKLGSVLMHSEFVDASRFAFDKAEKLSPHDARWPYLHGILLLTHEPQTALGKFQCAVELCADRTDMPRLRLAQLLAEQGRNNDAELHFQALLRGKPGHPLALLGLSRLRQAQGRFSESKTLLDSCLDNPHTAKSAHVMLATLQRALDNASAAENAARQSASLPADRPWPDLYWAEAARYRVGRKALIEDASNLMDQGQVNDALQLLTSVTREHPADEEAWYLTGWALNQQQQSMEAERALREHLARSPQSPKGHAQLAVALLNQRRYADAMEVLESGIKLKPTWREFHSNLGYACVQLGRHDEAIQHFRNALAQDPNYIGSYTALADLLSRRGEKEEARKLLRQALELSPTDERAKALLQRVQ